MVLTDRTSITNDILTFKQEQNEARKCEATNINTIKHEIETIINENKELESNKKKLEQKLDNFTKQQMIDRIEGNLVAIESSIAEMKTATTIDLAPRYQEQKNHIPENINE